MKAFLLSLLSLFPNFCSANISQNAKHVILVSMDGAAPYVIHQSNMPNLKKMAREGSYTWTAKTILPSITLPSHTSMVTGVGPEVHGILWNDWIPENGLVKVATVFSLAKQNGSSTALITAKPKFRHLDVPGTIDNFELVIGDADRVAHKAVQVFREQRPNFMMVHFRDADAAGHALGWGSREQKKSLEVVDAALGELLKMIEDLDLLNDTVFIVTADHGGHKKTHGSNLPEDVNIPWIAFGKGAHQGAQVQPIRTLDTAATSLWLLGIPVPKSFQGQPVLSAFQF